MATVFTGGGARSAAAAAAAAVFVPETLAVEVERGGEWGRRWSLCKWRCDHDQQDSRGWRIDIHLFLKKSRSIFLPKYSRFSSFSTSSSFSSSSSFYSCSSSPFLWLWGRAIFNTASASASAAAAAAISSSDVGRVAGFSWNVGVGGRRRSGRRRRSEGTLEDASLVFFREWMIARTGRSCGGREGRRRRGGRGGRMGVSAWKRDEDSQIWMSGPESGPGSTPEPRSGRVELNLYLGHDQELLGKSGEWFDVDSVVIGDKEGLGQGEGRGKDRDTGRPESVERAWVNSVGVDEIGGDGGGLVGEQTRIKDIGRALAMGDMKKQEERGEEEEEEEMEVTVSPLGVNGKEDVVVVKGIGIETNEDLTHSGHKEEEEEEGEEEEVVVGVVDREVIGWNEGGGEEDEADGDEAELMTVTRARTHEEGEGARKGGIGEGESGGDEAEGGPWRDEEGPRELKTSTTAAISEICATSDSSDMFNSFDSTERFNSSADENKVEEDPTADTDVEVTSAACAISNISDTLDRFDSSDSSESLEGFSESLSTGFSRHKMEEKESVSADTGVEEDIVVVGEHGGVQRSSRRRIVRRRVVVVKRRQKSTQSEEGGGGGGGKEVPSTSIAKRQGLATDGFENLEMMNAWRVEKGLPVRRSIGVDLGNKRTGVAVTHGGMAPRPVEVVQDASWAQIVQACLRIAQTEGADEFVVGLPLLANGQHSEQARKTHSFVNVLAVAAAQRGWRVLLFNEYSTTKTAMDYMLATGSNRRSRKTQIDSVAAAMLLRFYYESFGRNARMVWPKESLLQEKIRQSLPRDSADELDFLAEIWEEGLNEDGL